MSKLIRINKLLSQLGIASRRKADEMIAQGRVSVNNKILSMPGLMVDADTDRICINGKSVSAKVNCNHDYIMLNKPLGHITTLRDTHQRRTVMELVPQGKGLFPVGRLDKDTTGLLILTNDGELSHRLMHPSYEIEKTYEVKIAGAIKRPDIERIEDGVDIGDEKPSSLNVINIINTRGETIIKVGMHEGRKRQIRRTFQALGYKVKALQRIVYAGLKLDIKEGSFRQLTGSEVLKLKKAVNLI
jgi:23S rRNA pseudouridine2605 synthase